MSAWHPPGIRDCRTHPVNEIADSLVNLQVCAGSKKVIDGEPVDSQFMIQAARMKRSSYQGATAIIAIHDQHHAHLRERMAAKTYAHVTK